MGRTVKSYDEKIAELQDKLSQVEKAKLLAENRQKSKMSQAQ